MVILTIYILGFLATLIFFGYQASSDDTLINFILGVIGAIFWPFLVIIFLILLIFKIIFNIGVMIGRK